MTVDGSEASLAVAEIMLAERAADSASAEEEDERPMKGRNPYSFAIILTEENGVRRPRRAAALAGVALPNAAEWCGPEHSVVTSIAVRR